MTNRQLVSDIRSSDKLISSDSSLTDRAIFSLCKTTAIMLIKQQTDRRKLFQSPTLFTVINCFPMEQAPLAECCEYTSEQKISRSKNKIPKIGDSIFGLLIQYVNAVDNSTKFNEATAVRYANLLTLGRKLNKNYYWIYNDRLYVSNEDTKAVNFSAFFEDELTSDVLCPQDDCGCAPSSVDCDPCLNPLDRQFRCPGYLIQTVRTMVQKELLTTYFNLPADRTSDGKDDQSKP